MAEGVLIDGKVCPLLHPVTKHPIPVFGPDDTGMEFKIGDGFNKKRRVAIRGGVVHYTGSENPPETMFRVLNRRELGVEFCITPLGSLYFFCDVAKVDTADAGAANKFTWGVECISAGVVRAPKKKDRKNADSHQPKRGRYTATVNGKERKYLRLYPPQQQTLNALNALMVDELPDYEDNVCTSPDLINFRKFRGAFAHYNIKRGKTDVDPFTMVALDFHMRHRHLSGEEYDAAEMRFGF